MPYPLDQLNGEEAIALDLRPHWWFFVRPVLALIVAIGIGIAVLALGAPGFVSVIAGVLILVALIWFGTRYVVWATTNFVVTTDRLIYRSGVTTREGIEIPLERVNTVFFRQSLWERMIGSGDLTIESASETGQQSFSNIRKPLQVQNEIYRQMEDNENRKFDRAAGGGVQLSIPEQIDKLDELRRRGVVTEAEFQAKKDELLRRM